MPRDATPPPPCNSADPASRTDPERIAIDNNWPTRSYHPTGETSLDPEETTVANSPPIPESPYTEADRDLCRSFRHSGWAARRNKTHRALARCGFPAGRLDRFTECGSTAYVLKTPGPDPVYRIASNRCHDRFCVPCSTEKTRTIAANLKEHLPDMALRFITLTTRGTDQPLAVRLNKLYADFRRLRALLHSRKKISGGVAFLEISRNPITKQWHPHLHIIAAGTFIPQAWLRDRWLEITGDSYIVDVRLIRDRSEAAQYITKYAAKTLSAKVWNDHNALCEAITALSGRRAFNVFGDWTGFSLSKPPSDDVEWIYHETLATLIQNYRSGDPEAGRILSFLTDRSCDAPLPSDLPPEQ